MFKMNENESRRARRRSNNKSEDNSPKGISNVFYWIIGILFLILIGLAIFIFSRSGEDVNLDAENDQSAVVQEQPNEEPADDNEAASENNQEPTEEPEENQEETTEQPEDENNTENEAGEEEETDTEDTPDETETPEPGDNVAVNEDAPLNEGYAVDYSDGSSDRIAIRNQVIQTTGLGNNLIEWWIGNNGPGRVEATVSSRDESEVYRVYLQHGDGSWHVTSYERLSEVPANLR